MGGKRNLCFHKYSYFTVVEKTITQPFLNMFIQRSGIATPLADEVASPDSLRSALSKTILDAVSVDAANQNITMTNVTLLVASLLVNFTRAQGRADQLDNPVDTVGQLGTA